MDDATTRSGSFPGTASFLPFSIFPRAESREEERCAVVSSRASRTILPGSFQWRNIPARFPACSNNQLPVSFHSNARVPWENTCRNCHRKIRRCLNRRLGRRAASKGIRIPAAAGEAKLKCGRNVNGLTATIGKNSPRSRNG